MGTWDEMTFHALIDRSGYFFWMSAALSFLLNVLRVGIPSLFFRELGTYLLLRPVFKRKL